MRLLLRALSVTFLTTSLFAACTPATTPPVESPPQPSASASTEPAPEGPACAGKVDSPPDGVTATDEPPPSFAIGAPGKGALCEAKVYVAAGAVTVYRLFTASYETSKKAGPLGAYWTFQKPQGPKDAYRAAYEICDEWNDLDMLNECQIDTGAKLVLGPGQSADCEGDKDYPPSAANQVLIVRGDDGKVPVHDCKQSPAAW
ncbi:MAG: hypothetical protein R3B70_45600 [Polyangiaceae bacterium]